MASYVRVHGRVNPSKGIRKFSRLYGLFVAETGELASAAQYRHAEALKYWEYELKAGFIRPVEQCSKYQLAKGEQYTCGGKWFRRFRCVIKPVTK